MINMEEPKIYVDSLEKWRGKKASGYYDVFRNEIHVLNGEDQEQRTLIHEQIHASRRNKLTFKIAMIIQIPILSYLIFLGAMITAFFCFVGCFYPFMVFTSFLGICLLCNIYEEFVACRRCK